MLLTLIKTQEEKKDDKLKNFQMLCCLLPKDTATIKIKGHSSTKTQSLVRAHASEDHCAKQKALTKIISPVITKKTETLGKFKKTVY